MSLLTADGSLLSHEQLGAAGPWRALGTTPPPDLDPHELIDALIAQAQQEQVPPGIIPPALVFQQLNCMLPAHWNSVEAMKGAYYEEVQAIFKTINGWSAARESRRPRAVGGWLLRRWCSRGVASKRWKPQGDDGASAQASLDSRAADQPLMVLKIACTSS